jgi:hypothetical protein
MFIDEITTRVSVKIVTDELDNAIDLCNSDDILSEIGLAEELEDAKSKLTGLQEPFAQAVAEGLSSFQENIISSKHYKSGMMSNSVDIADDGMDKLVGNTASSVDGFPYPLAIEKGTRAHWVAPVTYSALHWGGTPGYFSKGHMVSGIEADPFVQPSIDDTIYAIDSIFDEVWGE